MALDVNFPEPILRALDEFIVDVELVPLKAIDPHLPRLDDRPLMLALRQEGYGWLVTNNYRMLRNPYELAGIIASRVNVFAIEGTGNDPLRATGAVFLDLPAAVRRSGGARPQMFWSRPRSPDPKDPRELFRDAAERQHTDPDELFGTMRVSDQERDTPWRLVVPPAD